MILLEANWEYAMNHKLILTSAMAALTCGIAAASASAASLPAGALAAHADGQAVQLAHYNGDHHRRKPWWYYNNYWGGGDYKWKPWWRKMYRHKDRDDYRQSSRDYDSRDRKYDGKRRRDW
jgi:hypothetical protein